MVQKYIEEMMDGIKIQSFSEWRAEREARKSYKMYNQDWNGKRKIIVREEYLLKMRKFTNSIKFMKSTLEEAALLAKKNDSSQTFTKEDSSRLDDVVNQKKGLQREFVDAESRLQTIEEIRKNRKNEEIQPTPIQMPVEAEPIVDTPQTKIDSPVESTINEVQKNMAEEVQQIAGLPTVNNMQDTQSVKEEIPFRLSDEQIGNIMNGLQQMAETPEGGNSIETVEKPVVIEQQDNKTDAGVVLPNEQVKSDNKQEIDDLVKKLEQPGEGFNKDMNEIMKQVAAIVKNYNKQISTITLTAVAEKQSEVDKLTKENVDKDAKIEQLTNNNNIKVQRIQTLESEAKDNQIRINNLTVMNAQKDEKIAILEREKQADQIRLENATQVIQQKDAELESLRRENETIRVQGQEFRRLLSQMQDLNLGESPINEEQPVQKVNAMKS